MNAFLEGDVQRSLNAMQEIQDRCRTCCEYRLHEELTGAIKHSCRDRILVNVESDVSEAIHLGTPFSVSPVLLRTVDGQRSVAYGNDDNWRAHYETTAEEILEQTGGRFTHVVAGVGTGGTITGLGRRLKKHDPRIRVVCILPEAFPGVEGLKPLGRPQDIVPAILDQSVIDERVPVTVDETYAMCQRLAAAGFFVGQSSGAYLAGVEHVARRERQGRFVTLFNDLGERYFSTRLWDA